MSKLVRFIVSCNPDLDQAGRAVHGARTERRDTFFFDENITVADALERAGFSRDFVYKEINAWKEKDEHPVTHPHLAIMMKDDLDFRFSLTLREAYCVRPGIAGVIVLVIANNGYCDIFRRHDCAHCEGCPGAHGG